MLYKVGITGNICSGKSSALKYLSSQKYSYGLNYDTFGHTVYIRNLFLLNHIKNIFYPLNNKIFSSNQKFNNKEYEFFNRKELGNLVFQNEKHMQVLNSLIRPEMKKLLKIHFMKLENELNNNIGILFVEGALIIEAGSQNLFDEIWMTVASHEEVEKRFYKRLTEANVKEYDKSILEQILKFQMKEEEKKNYCKEIIDTSQEYEITKLKYQEIYNNLLKKLNLII